jgi:hypothetical protein
VQGALTSISCHMADARINFVFTNLNPGIFLSCEEEIYKDKRCADFLMQPLKLEYIKLIHSSTTSCLVLSKSV